MYQLAMGLWKKIMKRFEWIVFDLDGTIIDSTNELYKIYKLFLKEFGFNGSKTEFNRLNGPKLEEIISILKSKYNIKEKKIDLLNNYNKKIQFGYKNKILPKKSSKKLLEFLARNQYKIGLVTSSSRKNTSLMTKIILYFLIIESSCGLTVGSVVTTITLSRSCHTAWDQPAPARVLKNSVAAVQKGSSEQVQRGVCNKTSRPATW